jgi:protein SCO1/2
MQGGKVQTSETEMDIDIKIPAMLLLVMGLIPLAGSGNNYVALDEHLGEYLPASLEFITDDSVRVNLADMIDRPTVISPVYYNCPGLCSPIMDGLVKLLNRTDLYIGRDFQVINISFHEGESPALASLKKRNYLDLLHDKQAGEHWHFMTGDSKNIDSLLEILGYSVIRRGEDILHPAAIMIVSPGKKIVKYIHGTKYNPIEFKMAVIEAEEGITMPTITKVLKMCFNYEPDGRDRQKRITILGFITMLSFALILIIVYPPLKNNR